VAAQTAALAQLAEAAGTVQVSAMPSAGVSSGKSSAGAATSGATSSTTGASGAGGSVPSQIATAVAGLTGQTGGGDSGGGNGANFGSETKDNNSTPSSSGLGASGIGSNQTSTPQTAASSQDPQTSDALGLLGDPAFVQQVPVTAQGVAQTSQGAALPPGMDQQTLAIEAVPGSNAAANAAANAAWAGDGSLAGAASIEGLTQPEEPGATSAAGTATLPQATSATPAEQIKVQLAKGMKDGSDSITILLHPEDLGTVEVKLQLQDGEVKANISADNPATLTLLRNDAHQLQQSLQNAGFNTDANGLSFQLRDSQQQNSAFAQQQQNNGQNGQNNTTARGVTADIVAEEALPTSLNSLGNGNGGLDISV